MVQRGAGLLKEAFGRVVRGSARSSAIGGTGRWRVFSAATRRDGAGEYRGKWRKAPWSAGVQGGVRQRI